MRRRAVGCGFGAQTRVKQYVYGCKCLPCALKRLYDQQFDKFRINLQRFKTSSGANIDVQLMDSDIHVLHD
jgi:hypothetical protein